MMFSRQLLKPLLIFPVMLMGIANYGQNEEAKPTVHERMTKHSEAIFDSLVKIRRDFYMHPELSGQEKRTSQKIAEYLQNLGLEVKTNIGGYGVVGILNGHKEGRRIAWRADIDALPSDIPDVVDFESENKGVRHICGHDVHTTIGLGIANVLASQKEHIDGAVYFVFQPSEENYEGAKAMINDGLFEIIQPDEMYALHITPIQKGSIATKPEAVFADYKILKLSFKNSAENDAIIDYTKEFISSFQNVDPKSPFWDLTNLLDPELGLGNPSTIFTDYVTVNKNFSIEEMGNHVSISTYVGASESKQLDSILSAVKQGVQGSKYSEQFVDAQYSLERGNVFNDKELTNEATDIISELYGSDKVIRLYGEMPDGRGDDFAYFQQHVPGTYFLLGGSNYEEGIISMPHAPNFAVDEEAIKTGVQFFSSMIIERVNN